MTDNAPMPPGFYNMDCMEAMKQFPDGFFSLAIVDPPYGIGVAGHENGQIVGGTDHSVEKRSTVYGVSRKAKARRNPTIPSTTAARRTKVISKNLNGCVSIVSFGAETSCWTIWEKRPA